ncbi:MAG: FGGY family carbohydrate kinase [Actinobacteria bacterium]|nr:FGGY family carbohydrate kinase [Actinomycetota bacterium]
MSIIAGVDSSTQSTKVEIRDLDTGKLIGYGKAPHTPTTPPLSEQDPYEWWNAFNVALAEALSAASTGSRHTISLNDIASISIAGQQHGLVVLDSSGEVIRPAKLWNDTQSAPDALRLRNMLDSGDSGWAEACGSVPVAALTITKLSWLKRVEPESFARIATILLPHDWLNYRLTGKFCTDRGDASGTGYWSPHEGVWRPDLLSLVDPDIDWNSMLPKVLAPDEPAGEWQGVVVCPGTGDNMASALGIGLTLGDTAISLGTSGTAFTVSEVPACDPSGYVSGFADASGRFLPLVCTLNATKVTDTVGKWVSMGYDALSEAVLREPLGAGGLIAIPYFDGERTPNRPSARGAFIGLSSDTSASRLARAAFEGVVCSLLDARDHLPAPKASKDTANSGEAAQDEEGKSELGKDRISKAEGNKGSLFLVGGGSRSHAYQQIFADLAGEEILVSTNQETVATGACVQAASIASSVHTDQIIEAWGLRQGKRITPSEGISKESVRQLRRDYSRIAVSTVWDM